MKTIPREPILEKKVYSIMKEAVKEGWDGMRWKGRQVRR